MKSKALFYFVAIAALFALVFFLFPINLFDGIVVYKSGVQSYELEQPLSLSYFIGLGYDESDMEIVQSFRLTTKGWIMAFIFIIGIPGLIAYRIHLGTKRKSQ